jgi:cytochrome P450
MMLAPFCLLHRNANAWSDPDRFDPSRFILDPDPDRARFLPFGTGPHVCIGAQLAITEAVLVLARLLSQFEVTLPAVSRPVLPVATLSTRPDHAPQFKVTER